MSWHLFAAQTALSFLGASQQAKADKKAAKAQKAWQEYSNTMTKLSDAQNQNAITTNQLIAAEASMSQALQIKKGSIITQARVETTAAAAGVKGRSVNQAMFEVMRNAAQAEYGRQVEMANANLAFTQQRRGSAMSAAMQQDYTYIPKPKTSSYMLNAAIQSFGHYNNYFGSQGSDGSDRSGQSYSSGTSIPNPNIAGTRLLL